MTQREREYLARNEPDMLRQYDRGDIRSVRDWLTCNASYISRWMGDNPESSAERMAREQFERDNRGAAGN